jgi:hypothetical protein
MDCGWVFLFDASGARAEKAQGLGTCFDLDECAGHTYSESGGEICVEVDSQDALECGDARERALCGVCSPGHDCAEQIDACEAEAVVWVRRREECGPEEAPRDRG